MPYLGLAGSCDITVDDTSIGVMPLTTFASGQLPVVVNERIKSDDIANGWSLQYSEAARAARTKVDTFWVGPNGVTIGDCPHSDIAPGFSLDWLEKASGSDGAYPIMSRGQQDLCIREGYWTGRVTGELNLNTAGPGLQNAISTMLGLPPGEVAIRKAFAVDWLGHEAFYRANAAAGSLVVMIPMLWAPPNPGNWLLAMVLDSPPRMKGIHALYWHDHYSLGGFFSTVVCEPAWAPIIKGAMRGYTINVGDGGEGFPIREMVDSGSGYSLPNDPTIKVFIKRLLPLESLSPSPAVPYPMETKLHADQQGPGSYGLRRYVGYAYGAPDLPRRITWHGTPTAVSDEELRLVGLKGITLDWAGETIGLIDPNMTTEDRKRIAGYDVITAISVGDPKVPPGWVGLYSIYNEAKDNGIDLRDEEAQGPEGARPAKTFREVEASSEGKSIKVTHRLCSKFAPGAAVSAEIATVDGALRVTFFDRQGVEVTGLTTDQQIVEFAGGLLVINKSGLSLGEALRALYGVDPSAVSQEGQGQRIKRALDAYGKSYSLQRSIMYDSQANQDDKNAIILENFGTSRETFTSYAIGALGYSRMAARRLRKYML